VMFAESPLAVLSNLSIKSSICPPFGSVVVMTFRLKASAFCCACI